MTAEGAPERARPVNGQLSYLEIPALDREQSAAFYEALFGWQVRGEGDERAFSAPGGLLGRWIVGPSNAPEGGVRVYISVDSVDETVRAVQGAGGQVVLAPYAEGDLRVAAVSDPAGNVIGIWQRGNR